MKTKKGGARLEVRDTRAMGRGVFAGRPIGKGELIEACPVIPLSLADERSLAGTTLDHYLFAWREDTDSACLVLGLGSLYNHSPTPNAVACRVEEATRIDFIALRDIAAGEQVFVDYQWAKSEYNFCSGREADIGVPPSETFSEWHE
jgi:SET domain-containing protein